MPEFGEEDPWFEDDEDYEDLLMDAETDLADEIERRGFVRPQAVI